MNYLACQGFCALRDFLRRSPAHTIHIHWCTPYIGVIHNEFVDTSAREALKLAPPDIVSLSAARSRVVECMRCAWRAQAEHTSYCGNHLALPREYHSQMFARFTRVVTGHALIAFTGTQWSLSTIFCGSLESLDPFADVLWFLRMNQLVVTFEFADYQQKAQEELDRGVEDGSFCNLLHHHQQRARVWNEAPPGQREAALAAFDAEQGRDS
ncbi:hypothetical protein OBBRIDRAFT_840085 [Obba rivulosa]|uniref:RNase H type-1 domain-containing protein n=1 Tax=Obba rivulosa TaxID=1052685 RepID=A0A8E2DFL7_9APHY|nr:hypothetical protein OBBRIDRAFT_840085 [Obba rivulosa]